MARAGAARLEAAGVGAILLPSLAFTAAPFAAEFAGTLSVAARDRHRAGRRSRARADAAGFRARSASRTPISIRRTAPRWPTRRRAPASERLLKLVCPDLTRKPWATRLTEEFRERRLPCRPLRGLDRDGRAARSGARGDPARRSRPIPPRSPTRSASARAPLPKPAARARTSAGRPTPRAEEGRRTVAALGAHPRRSGRRARWRSGRAS